MKHDSTHTFYVACLECMKVHLRHKEMLIEFVKDIKRYLDNSLDIQPNSSIHRYIGDLIQEIEADND